MTRIVFSRNVFNLAKNDEYQSLIKTIFKRLDDEVIEENHISDVVSNAKRHLEGITDIATKTNFHGNTQLMMTLAEERREMIMGLSYAIKSDLFAETKEKKEAARLAYIWIRSERKLISKLRIEGQSGMVNRLQAEVQKKPEIGEALELIHADERFKRIVELTEEIEGMFIKRNQDIKTNPINMKLPREKCNEDMQTMLEALAGMANMNGPNRAKYHNLCLEIQGLITSSNAKVANRKTRSANREEKNQEGSNAPEGENNSQEPVVSYGKKNESGIEYIPDSNESSDSDDLIFADLSTNGTDTE